MPLKELYEIFPKLANTQTRITSCHNCDYNCVAWVFDDQTKWYEPFGTVLPSPKPPYFWPPELPNHPDDRRSSTYVKLFELYGYEVVDSDSIEPGFQKIAIYVHNGEFRHVARQTKNGYWTSKIGALEDIIHELSALESEGPFAYGKPRIFMRKPL